MSVLLHDVFVHKNSIKLWKNFNKVKKKKYLHGSLQDENLDNTITKPDGFAAEKNLWTTLMQHSNITLTV